MRNLKRALSLALASVMLLGMMVVGSSAAFADADEIVNKEAVEITAGLGLFAGSDGKFNPTGTVTRAQMATVIAKMLYGSEINADQFKGTGKFSDTVAFEGGWAEGYISLCANLGIVGGYGDGTFKPGNAVTTAEAVTMIINALGVDAGKGTWPLTVMAKAEEMKLFAELAVKPGTNVALTRDQLASIVLEGVKYSPAGINGYEVDGVDGIVFDKMADALTAAMAKYPATIPNPDYDPANPTAEPQTITNPINAADKIKEVTGEDALWNTVFEVKSATGYVTSNIANDWDSVGTVLDYDAKKTFAIETGKELIGHYVTVYYKEAYTNEKNPGVAYCVVDESETVTVALPDGGIDTYKEYREAFGSKNYTVALSKKYDGDMAPATGAISGTVAGNAVNYTANGTTFTAPNGTYVIYDNVIVSYIAPANTYVAKVVKVTTSAGKETIKLGANTYENNETEDEIVEYDGIAKDDLVSYVVQGNQIIVSKLDKVTGKATSVTKNKDNNKPIITLNGTAYEWFTGRTSNIYEGTTGLQATAIGWTAPTNFFNQEIDLYVNAAGKMFGYTAAASAADVSEMIYVVNVYQTTAQNTYGLTVRNTYAQGVDMEGKEVNILLNVENEKVDTTVTPNVHYYESVLKAAQTSNAGDPTDEVNFDEAIEKVLATGTTGFFTFEKCGESDGNKEGIMTAKAVSSTYNKTTNPVYSGTASTTDTNGAVNSKTKTVDVAYITENTKFIMTTGTGTQMKIGMTTGSATVANVSGAGMLMSKDASGNVMLEVLVVAADPSGLAADVIYVGANDLDATSVDGNGYTYKVYDANKGEVIVGFVTDDATLAPINAAGFYKYEYDAEDGLYDLNTALINSGNGYMDQKFVSVYNNMLMTQATNGGLSISNFDVTNAVIVDTRTEKQMKAQEIEAVADFTDLQYLVDAEGENATVIIDVWTDVAEEEVKVIFVKQIILPPQV